jgi:hypothetical protein
MWITVSKIAFFSNFEGNPLLPASCMPLMAFGTSASCLVVMGIPGKKDNSAFNCIKLRDPYYTLYYAPNTA